MQSPKNHSSPDYRDNNDLSVAIVVQSIPLDFGIFQTLV
jgi:hypothetical protein